MAKIVCYDALIYLGGLLLPERNEVEVLFDVTVEEVRKFPSSLTEAYVQKVAIVKKASVSMSGYYDDQSFDAIDKALQGTRAQLFVYPSRSDLRKYWKGMVVINSVENEINSEDYSELNIEASVDGKLEWINAVEGGYLSQQVVEVLMDDKSVRMSQQVADVLLFANDPNILVAQQVVEVLEIVV